MTTDDLAKYVENVMNLEALNDEVGRFLRNPDLAALARLKTAFWKYKLPRSESEAA